MPTKLVRHFSMVALFAMPLVACGGGTDGAESPLGAQTETEPVGRAQEAFSGNSSYSWGDTHASSVDIGTSVHRTCFLSGVGGNLRPSGAYLFSNGHYPAMAGVHKNANGNYELFVQPEDGKPIVAKARCVNTEAGRLEVSSSSAEQADTGNTVLGAATGKRQCFLTEIRNFEVARKGENGDIESYSWAFHEPSVPDEVRVVDDGAYWKLIIKPGAHDYPVNIHASAVCIDANAFDGAWTWKAGDPGTAQINLTSVAGATCGLSGVRGAFAAASGDWGDGVAISAVGSQFKLDLKNGKRGWVACMR